MDIAVLEAADEVGIRIVLLHANYAHGGFGKSLSGGQRRFATASLGAWWERVDALAEIVDGSMQRIGTVAHSVRAVDIETIKEIAVGSGKGISMHDLANIFQSKTGCEIELNQRDDDEVFGVVDAWVLEERLGFRPRISLEEMIDEAFEAAQ